MFSAGGPFVVFELLPRSRRILFRLFGDRHMSGPLSPVAVLYGVFLLGYTDRIAGLGYRYDHFGYFSLPVATMLDVQDLLLDWTMSRTPALESEVRELIRKWLHVYKIVRPGKLLLCRMLNYLELPVVKPWPDKIKYGMAHGNGPSRFI